MYPQNRTHWWVAGINLLVASIAHGTTPLDPTDASAPVPTVEYRAVWPHYRADQSPTVADWKQANQAVSKLKPGTRTQEAIPQATHQHTPERSEPSRHDHEAAQQEHCPMMGRTTPHCNHHDKHGTMNCEGDRHDHH